MKDREKERKRDSKSCEEVSKGRTYFIITVKDVVKSGTRDVNGGENGRERGRREYYYGWREKMLNDDSMGNDINKRDWICHDRLQTERFTTQINNELISLFRLQMIA